MGKTKPAKEKPLRRLMAYAGAYKILTVLSMIFSAVSAALVIVPFVYIWRIIEEVIRVRPDFSQAQHIAFNGWMAVLFSVAGILVYLAALMCSHFSAFRVAANIRKDTVRHVTQLPVGSLDMVGSGKARRIIHDSSAATETYLAHQLPDMARAFVTPVAVLVLLFVFDWRLGLASLIPVIVSFVLLAVMLGKRAERVMAEFQNALGDMNNQAVEYVRGMTVIKTFGQTVFSFKRFSDSIERYREYVVQYTLSMRKAMMVFQVLTGGIFAFIIAAAFIILSGGPPTAKLITDLIFYIIFTPLITLMLNKIMYSSQNNLIVRDALKRIDSLLALAPLPEPENPMSPGGADLELRDVTFRYEGAEIPAVDGISLAVKQGQRIALVGPSGGGKTTVAGLISRFWDVQSGSIRIGGVDIKDIKKEELMDTVAFVFQDSKLIKGSIFDNVRLARPSASRPEVLAALRAAQCDDILQKLPDGADTVYGSKGVYLSGGECQRITIARAILKDAPVIILDEATAFADPENEAKVQAAFASMAKNKTVIVIAHRLTTVTDCDGIYVLSGGRIAEAGRHEALVAAGGLYAGMWADYQRSVEWKVKREAV
ncbi:MAG: ABC transporter ATP-binding protein/permease [Clostridiales bacterium]|jgi:ATP-binding cassette subfamily B protein|nr:ABC transporter ATP-binding protein/permease [Clostridiales bacterium]